MKLRKIFLPLLLLGASSLSAQECALPISVQLDEEFAGIPSAATTLLHKSLQRIATENGLATDMPLTPFVLTAHCDVLDKSNLPGPPIQTVYDLGLTLYMADTYTMNKFATAYIEIHGVGKGEVKAYTDAFKHISAQGTEIKRLITDGKKRMMDYYNTQYANIIKEAQRLESLQKYEEAIAMVLSIPTCSAGGDAATTYGVQLYTKHLDRMNLYLLNQARALWASGQDSEAAHSACALLAQIDPDAACYADAQALMKEVKSQVRSDIDFEMRQKYNDQIDLEKSRIAAARAVGVAYGNNQKQSTTNLMWLR